MFIFNFTDEPASILPVATRAHAEKLLDALTGAAIIETVDDLADLTGPQLVLLHNALANRIIDGPRPDAVIRFSTRDAAKRRVWALAHTVQIGGAREVTSDEVMEVIADAEEPVSLDNISDTLGADVMDVAGHVADLVTEGAVVNQSVDAPVGQFVPVDREQPAPFIQEAIARSKADTAKSSTLKRGGTPVINRKANVKLVAAREGSVQALFIDLLARPEGASFSELREAQHVLATQKGSKLWGDSTVTSGLGWDVNSVKGYGIATDADGRYRLTYPEGTTAPLSHTPLKGRK